MSYEYSAIRRQNERQAEQQLRALLRREYGDKNYRITRDGAVHVRRMPSIGWCLLGDRRSVERDYNI